MSKTKGLLFGINYVDSPSAKLNGCINDVRNIATFLRSELGMPCDVFTDDVNKRETSAMGIVQKLYELATLSYREKLDLVWIHYSGHGSYIVDRSGDETDGKDECLVPADYAKAGLISDDYLASLFALFNPKTKVIAVFDCCHSGTIGDLKFSWEGPSKCTIENAKSRAQAKVISISGCLDDQVSMDAFLEGQYAGALTTCLLQALKTNKQSCFKNVFSTLESLRGILKQKGFVQIPKLCSTHDLSKDVAFL